MKNNIFTAVTNKLGKTGNKFLFGMKKRSPELLLIASGIGIVAGTVMACKATLKANDILDTHKENMEKIHAASEAHVEDYKEKDAKRDKVVCFTQTGLKMVKLYMPSALVFACSFGAALVSHKILTKRVAGFAAAYAAVDRAFKEYRARVVDKYGAEIDKAFRFGLLDKKEVETTVTDENGDTKTVKEEVNIATETSNPYIRYLKKGHPFWSNNQLMIEKFLTMKQSVVNNLLKYKGHLTLNEVYDELEFEHTKAGMVCGWIYDLRNPTGDNYIQFDVKKVELLGKNGNTEPAYAIDFNVDGNIYNMMS